MGYNTTRKAGLAGDTQISDLTTCLEGIFWRYQIDFRRFMRMSDAELVRATELTQLIPRRANVSRPGGPWSEHDFAVIDGYRNVGRIYRVGGRPDGEWIGVSRSN